MSEADFSLRPRRTPHNIRSTETEDRLRVTHLEM